MRSFQNTTSVNLLTLLFLAIILALAIALASPVWLGTGGKTHAAPAKSVTQQGIPPTPAPTPTPVVSQGVAVHGTLAWEHDGYTGSTIKVGIIDRDFKGFSGLMGTELPENTPIITRVHRRCYTAAGVPTDVIANCEHSCTVDCPSYVGHGTSVSEIIADVAPSVTLYISDASEFNKKRDLKTAVEWMAGEGVKVINHSIGLDINAPGDGSSGLPVADNHILDVIDYAVTNGIIWVNSGGNDALKTWYGPYRDGTTLNTHDFNSSLIVDEGNNMALQKDTTIYAELRWEDSWNYADCDLDLYLKRSATSAVVGISGDDYQKGRDGDHPYEILTHTASATADYYLTIKKFNCSDPPDWMQLRLTATTNLQHYSGDHDVGVPAESNNAGMLAVGAARHDNTTKVRDSSNRGPTVLPYPAGRTKPDLVGASCVATKTDPPELCGTSAAAPHIAGLAALVRERYPTYTPAQVATYLKTNALVRGGSVPNHEWGNGLAYLPPRGTITPAPSTVAVNTYTALSVNTNVPSPGTGISLNETTDTGNLSLSSACPGSTNLAARRIDGDAIIIRGCRAGTATVKVYDPTTNNFLQTYTVNVTAAPTAAPAGSSSAISKTLYIGDTETIEIARKFTGSVASYTVVSSNTPAATASITGYDLTITAVAAGSATVTVTATNSLGSATQTYNLTILTPVPPSTVGTIANQSMNIGDTTTVNVSGYFDGNVDSYSVTSSNLTQATAVLNGPILTVTGIAAGSPTVTVTATNNTNAIGTATQTFTVTVTSLVPMASGTPGNQSVNVGASTTVGVSGYFTGDVDRFSAASWNTAVATASMSGSNLTITGVAAGSTTIRVTATNTTNAIGTATQDYSVTVTAATTTPTPGGPTIPTGGPSVNAGSKQTTVARGATVSLAGTGSPVDDDDDASYSWTQEHGTTVSLKNAVKPSLPYTSGLAGNSAKFTAPSTAGTLIFRLTVTDAGTGISSGMSWPSRSNK